VIKFPRLFAILLALSALAARARAADPRETATEAAGDAAPGSPAAGRPGPSAYGLIWLDVDPGPAEVSLDGEFLDAGVWLISVSPGDHDLRIRKAGFRGYAGRIAVPAGGSVHLDVRLQPGAAGDS
jgi:hypothetical protein